MANDCELTFPPARSPICLPCREKTTFYAPFPDEWVNYDWDGQSYWNLTPEAWFRCMRFVLGLDRFPLDRKLVVEVGMGIGGVADYLAREENCETVGVDLGHAVDAGYRHFGRNPFLHVVQASALRCRLPIGGSISSTASE